ncbi:MAG: hypothetical protein ACKVOK_01485 [Flavobacteriales bacterium]
MKKVKWSSSLFLFIVLLGVGCSGPDSGKSVDESASKMNLSVAAPPPGSCLEATSVHKISYNVLKFLGNDYIDCNCNPRLDTLFFGSFLTTQSIQKQLANEDVKGVYLHLCLNSDNKFYLGMSGATDLSDSLLKAESFYPVGSGGYKFKATSFDTFIDNESFAYPTLDTVKGSVILDDRLRFASVLTCDLNGDNAQDSLSTVPYGFINRGELEELLSQSSAPYIALMMGYDGTMYPSVMRVMLASTKPNGTNQMKLVKMDPAASTHYALFLERTRP